MATKLAHIIQAAHECNGLTKKGANGALQLGRRVAPGPQKLTTQYVYFAQTKGVHVGFLQFKTLLKIQITK
jgi:hypothetical protein